MRGYVTPLCPYCALEADWNQDCEICGIPFGQFWCYVCNTHVDAIVEEPESIDL